jgi:hypothetical protein
VILKRLLFVFAATLLATMCSMAAIIDFATTFNPEADGATGTGQGFFQFDTDAQTLFIDVSWSGLSAGTSVAHIHCCVATPGVGTVGVAVTPGTLPEFPNGLQSGSYSVLLDLTDPATYTAGFVTNFAGGVVEDAGAVLLENVLAGRAYFNIHSTNFPAGEIRGFLHPVPEPSTLGLAALGLLGLAFYRRRKAR